MDSPQTTDDAGAVAEFARSAVWLLRIQGVLVAVAAVIAVVLAGTGAAMAVLAGGGIGIVLTAVSALRTGVAPGAPERKLAGFYRGMALKMLLAVACFVAVAIGFPEAFLPVLAGYLVTLLGYWAALLRLGTGSSASETRVEQGSLSS